MLGDFVLIGIHAFGAAFPYGTLGIAHNDIFEAHSHEQFDDGNTRSARAAGNNGDFIQFFANNFQRVHESRQGNNGGSVLVVVKNGALEDAVLFQGIFNNKAFGSLDVFKVHAAKGRSHKFHKLNDLAGILGVHADGKGIHIAKCFEKQ